jgi:hypothetical protein
VFYLVLTSQLEVVEPGTGEAGSFFTALGASGPLDMEALPEAMPETAHLTRSSSGGGGCLRGMGARRCKCIGVSQRWL